MFPTLLSLWRTLSGKTSRKDRPRRRPFLEVLEDRAVPASLGYSTYLPGTVYASTVDSTGDIYVTGSGGFVAKLNPTGTTVLYSTTLGNGGVAGASGTGIAVNSAGDAYVMGLDSAVPTSSNAIASSSSGNVFVAELNPAGGLAYATYLPGAFSYGKYTEGYSGAIAVDGAGSIYVAGAAEAGFPVTTGAFQTSLASTGETNAFFAKINPALSASASLVYATYLGGNASLYAKGDAATGMHSTAPATPT